MKSHRLLLTISMLLCHGSAAAQYHKVNAESSSPSLQVVQVDYKDSSTFVTLRLTRTDGVDWSNISDGTFARANGSAKKYRLLNSINMPISSQAEEHSMLFEIPDQQHCFALEFEKLPFATPFDIIEDERLPNGYNIYNILADTTSTTDHVDLDQMVSDYPIYRERGAYIRDDRLIQYVRANGIVIATNVTATREYGKYYTVSMILQNFSGRSVLFSTDNVQAEGYITRDGASVETVPMTVLSAAAYDKKVANRQGWNSFFVVLAEGMASAGAGYSTSSTSYVGSSHGYTTAYGSTYTTTYGTANTSTYNAAAAYAARQQANANYQEFADGQYEIRKYLNDGYAKTNTIQDREEYSGFFNIKYKKVDHLRIVFNIGGTEFPFFL